MVSSMAIDSAKLAGAIIVAMPNTTNRELLSAALAGYQHQLAGIHARMAEIRSALGVKGPARATPNRTMSAAGRASIAAAQRARWAASKKQAAAAKPKPRLSAAGRAAIVAATKKRWAAVRAAKA